MIARLRRPACGRLARGTAHYGRLTGLLSAPVTVSIALAPSAGAGIADLTGGYGNAFLVIAVIGTAGAVFGLARST